MKLLASLDPKDRRILLLVLGLVTCLLFLLAVFTPTEDPSSSQVPDSYQAGQHGAKAAFQLLQQGGYSIERWERPLSELAAEAGPGTVVIVAEPFSDESADKRAVAAILEKGGRVLATGMLGGFLLPGNLLADAKVASFAACEAQPEGLEPLAGSGSIWIVPRVAWNVRRPEVRTAYTCGGQAVVVEYPVEKGHVVWWASATPLENGSILRGQNLELLLHSIGPAAGQHVYWDESLHGQLHSAWDYVKGPVWPLFWMGGLGLGLLVVLSYSRRSGPVRELPQRTRTTPIEFLEALGALYRSAGATSTVVEIAWERFRVQVGMLTGQQTTKLNARQLAEVIERRFGAVSAGMDGDLVAVEEACWDEALKQGQALRLVQAMRRHEETLREMSSRAGDRATAQRAS